MYKYTIRDDQIAYVFLTNVVETDSTMDKFRVFKKTDGTRALVTDDKAYVGFERGVIQLHKTWILEVYDHGETPRLFYEKRLT